MRAERADARDPPCATVVVVAVAVYEVETETEVRSSGPADVEGEEGRRRGSARSASS